MKKKPIILLGAGGHCISCIDVIEQLGEYRIIGILEHPDKKGTNVLGYSIIGTDNDLPKLISECQNFAITIGQVKSSIVRQNLFNNIKNVGGYLPVIISPKAYVSQHATIEEGTIIMHQALINAGAKIGKACIINSKALIEHEVTVGDFCHISTGACLNGQVSIGASSFVGSNAVVSNNLSVVENTIIAAGSQVLKSLLQPGVYVGNPLRKRL